MQKRTMVIAVLIVSLILALAPAVLAQLNLTPHGKLGPINIYVPSPDGGTTPATGNGFPEWIEDSTGVRLDLPVKPYGDGVNAPTLIFDPPITGNQLSLDTGFGAEAFFFLANSTMTLPNGGQAVLDLAIEAAYGAGEPLNGDEFLFARVRVRFDATVAGTYTVRHPWGEETLTVTTADLGRFIYVSDFGGLAPLCTEQTSCFDLGISESPGFERILISPRQWRFLKADPANINLAASADPIEKTYMVGDGVTPTTVTGGVGDFNSFTITGPANAFGTTNTATTTLFTVSGHIYGMGIPTIGPPAQPPQQPTTDVVTITRARLRNNTVEVRATSSNGFAMTGELYAGGVGGTLVGSANLGTSGRANIAFSATPDTLRVHSTSTNPLITAGVAIAPVQ